jgi:MFS family permease
VSVRESSSAPVERRSHHRHDDRATTVVNALVAQGLVATASRAAAAQVVENALAAPIAAPAGRRQRWAELAGYVGGTFVVAAAVLFFVEEWAELTRTVRVGLLTGTALVLAGVAVALVATAGGRHAVVQPAEAVRRRLAGVLLVGSAAAGGFAAGIWADAWVRPGTWSEVPVMVGLLTALLLTVGGYLIAPTAFGQVAVAVAATAGVPATLEVVATQEPLQIGLAWLAIGVLWLVLVEQDVWFEPYSARVVGCVLVVLGAQVLIADQWRWIGYLATLLVAAAGFALYVRRRAWPYLAVGVAGLTLVVPEALLDWTEGSLGTAGVLLAAGLTLLGASLVGHRLRSHAPQV